MTKKKVKIPVVESKDKDENSIEQVSRLSEMDVVKIMEEVAKAKEKSHFLSKENKEKKTNPYSVRREGVPVDNANSYSKWFNNIMRTREENEKRQQLSYMTDKNNELKKANEELDFYKEEVEYKEKMYLFLEKENELLRLKVEFLTNKINSINKLQKPSANKDLCATVNCNSNPFDDLWPCGKVQSKTELPIDNVVFGPGIVSSETIYEDGEAVKIKTTM